MLLPPVAGSLVGILEGAPWACLPCSSSRASSRPSTCEPASSIAAGSASSPSGPSAAWPRSANGGARVRDCAQNMRHRCPRRLELTRGLLALAVRLADVPARRVSRASPHPRSQVTRECESSRPLAACARKEMEDGDARAAAAAAACGSRSRSCSTSRTARSSGRSSASRTSAASAPTRSTARTRADAAVAAACLACPDRRVGAAAAGCRYAGASATPSRWRRVRRRARAAHGGAPAARASPRLGASARRLREGV